MTITRLFSCRSAVIGLSLLLVLAAHWAAAGRADAQACALPADLSPMSGCIDPGNRNVVVGPAEGPQCTNVVVDASYTGASALGKIKVKKGGSLYVPDATVAIETPSLDVDGFFQAGTARCPIGTANPANKVTITFTGSRPCPVTDQKCAGFNKGLIHDEGGRVSLFGAKGAPAARAQQVDGVSWTHLAAAAGPEDLYGAGKGVGQPVPPGGGSSLVLAKDVTKGPGAWQRGDWIAVATTSFSPYETEIVQINTLEAMIGGRTKVTLVQPLVHYHFGGPDPGPPGIDNYTADASRNFGVDERAEVGLISRNIKLTAAIPDDTNSRHWGGEILVGNGFGQLSLQGVEIEKFGKDQLGSYPVHLHELGPLTAGKVLVDSNSIHHSYNKCITVHSSSNITFSRNVCARIVGHIFYQEIGDEDNIRFVDNLGMGAMSNYFDIRASDGLTRRQLIQKYFWAGDNLGQPTSPSYNGYDGFNIYNNDAQTNPTHGKCFVATKPRGSLVLAPGEKSPGVPKENPPCLPGLIYTEPASGFWIINPATVLTGNSIAGCQGVGRGYWYVPPAEGPTALQKLKFRLLGEFKNNRVHGCYAGLYAEPEFGVRSEQIQPRAGGVEQGRPVIATFDGITATRNRFRSVWLRPFWYHVTNARLATSRENVTLVSSGGLDGNAPGVWALLDQSVIVGLSTNNVDRFGPCPYETNLPLPPGERAGGPLGCIDETPFPNGVTPTSGDQTGDGYPSPRRNFFGYMIYDGPVRIFNNRFVKFKQPVATSKEQPGLTATDQAFLAVYSAHRTIPNTPSTNTPFVYEGDAALGWFQANQSGYPTATASKGLLFKNVDLRHQIYTDLVNVDKFQDGDKNTAIIDLDGSLAGYAVVDALPPGTIPPIPRPVRRDAFPISLNNLPFNGSSNSVDECRSEGRQNVTLEGRPTSLMSPGSMATLEFEAIFPDPEHPADTSHRQILTFRRDNQDFGEHPPMALKGRDGRGVWEPKVTSGHGYTVGADVGIPRRINVGLVDAVKPQVGKGNPFYVRMGVCYTSKTANQLTQEDFLITRGHKSWGGAGVFDIVDRDLNRLWTKLENRYQSQVCIDLDSGNTRNLDPVTGCPAAGVRLAPEEGCLDGSVEVPDVYPPVPTDPQPHAACVYDRVQLTKVGSVHELLDPQTGLPLPDKYFYDRGRRMLFFYVQQPWANAFGPSPLGSCTGGAGDDPACPDLADHESYYPCPPQGCASYVVRIKDAVAYEPGPSTCAPYPFYKQDDPDDLFELWDLAAKEVVTRVSAVGKDNIGHYEPQREPVCAK